MKQNHRWPEGAVVYQIYPRSFYDSNGDGIGDIAGITEKLDYLKDLGVNVIWLSPFYPSPMVDFGYDVADYCDVDPIFGNLNDMEKLIAAAHKRGIRLMADLVPNHTSDEHEWFRQSRQSHQNPHADWYIWRDPKGHDKDGKPIPPNNWINVFTGTTAWEWEPARQQFYLHSFDTRQPDLNWTNPAVREAIKDVMRFWLDKGIDGFRVDAVPFMAKDPMLRNDPPNKHFVAGRDMSWSALEHVYSYARPQLYAYLSEMAAVLKEDKYLTDPRFMVMEAYPTTMSPIEDYLQLYEGVDPSVSAPFNFEGLSLPWEAAPWRQFLSEFHAAIDAFSPLCISSYAFGNHDQPRIVSRLGEIPARSAAVLLLTLPGMVFIYNGDEIGMKNGHIPPELIQDPGAIGSGGKDEEDISTGQFVSGGRDPERTPLQWTAGKNAGFSTAATTWLPIADNYKTHNVETEAADPSSFLSLYRQLGNVRNSSEALRYGSYSSMDVGNDKVLAYRRVHGNEAYAVVINFTDKSQPLKANAPLGTLIVSSNPKTELAKDDKLRLLPNEAAIFKQ